MGLSQPWDFILVDDEATKAAFWGHVQEQRQVFADTLDRARSSHFAAIKIDGVRESILSIVVGYDRDRGGPGVLGRHSLADAGLYSVCLAIENLWLAVTAEGWGVGWVSFYQEQFLRELLAMPASLRPVAWLCRTGLRTGDRPRPGGPGLAEAATGGGGGSPQPVVPASSGASHQPVPGMTRTPQYLPA